MLGLNSHLFANRRSTPFSGVTWNVADCLLCTYILEYCIFEFVSWNLAPKSPCSAFARSSGSEGMLVARFSQIHVTEGNSESWRTNSQAWWFGNTRLWKCYWKMQHCKKCVGKRLKTGFLIRVYGSNSTTVLPGSNVSVCQFSGFVFLSRVLWSLLFLQSAVCSQNGTFIQVVPSKDLRRIFPDCCCILFVMKCKQSPKSSRAAFHTFTWPPTLDEEMGIQAVGWELDYKLAARYFACWSPTSWSTASSDLSSPKSATPFAMFTD